MANWLFKIEPDCFSYSDLEAAGTTVWDGVSNALALKHLRAAQPGDRVFLYHTGKEKAATLRQEMQTIMMDNVSVFRTEALISEALTKVRELKTRFAQVQIDDKGKRFNTDLLETFELGCLLDLAEVTAVSALNRTESRGAHSREDFPKRDDVNWMKHTLATIDDANKGVSIDYRPVHSYTMSNEVSYIEPKARVY